MSNEIEYRDSRQYEYRPMRFDNKETRRIILYGILRGIVNYSDEIIYKTVSTVFELIKLGPYQPAR
jgi:hypothetical protein